MQKMGAPDKVTRLLLTLPYVTVDCLCKCDPKPECLILSGTSFKTSFAGKFLGHFKCLSQVRPGPRTHAWQPSCDQMVFDHANPCG